MKPLSPPVCTKWGMSRVIFKAERGGATCAGGYVGATNYLQVMNYCDRSMRQTTVEIWRTAFDAGRQSYCWKLILVGSTASYFFHMTEHWSAS
jgi:hypothetical protein